MKREIKFRAWHTKAKEMLFENVLGDVFKWIKEGQPIDIMQFTGLKDKNGVDIYEGDICRILYTDWPSNSNPDISLEDYLISISSIGNIEYHAPSFYIMMLNRYDELSANTLDFGKHGFIEVIGNIQENQELLIS